MKAYRLYGEGAALPCLGDYAIDRAYKLICMNLSTDADALVWPKYRSLVVSWYRLDAKLQERG
jgi:hypothetical protein